MVSSVSVLTGLHCITKINDNQTSFVNQNNNPCNNNNLWVKKETSTNFSLEFLMSTSSPNTERVRLQRNVMDWEQLLHFEWQANARVSGEAAKGGGNEELSLSFPAFNSPSFRLVSLATRAWLLSESLLASCYGFIFVRDGCIVIIMAHSIVPSVPTPIPVPIPLISAGVSFGSRHLSKCGQNCTNSRL